MKMNTLLILAAGMASRYGSLKQVEQVGPSGETILDYSIYDAIKAGFKKVVFIIRPEIEKEFKKVIIKRLENYIEVNYVFQDINMVPAGFKVPKERVKPWGTSHAVLVAADKINEPFAVINADDYYGTMAFEKMAEFLSKVNISDTTYSMVGYFLNNTLSEFGTVSRGVCETNQNSFLTSITERTKIMKENNKVAYQNENGQLTYLNPDSIVSMNFWGFTPAFFKQVFEQFAFFLVKNMDNPKAEIYLPLVLDELIRSGQGSVKVLPSNDKWFGITYKEDRDKVVTNIKSLVDSGVYPQRLWN
jgi:NDP-sugar pyrophosphorylase family protein